MRTAVAVEKIHKETGPVFFTGLVIFMCLIGMVMLFSASYHFSAIRYSDSFYMVVNQLIYFMIGIVLMFIISRIPLEFFKKSVFPLVVVAFLLMLLTYIPGIGKSVNGAQRWIFIGGRSFQPSEFVKLVMIIYLANLFSKKQERMDNPLVSVLPPYLITVVFVGLIYLQNDFSTAFFIFLLAICMFYLSGVKLQYLFGVLFFTIVCFLMMVFTKAYRLERFLNWTDPTMDPSGSGYQMLSIMDAFDNGGLFGRGIGYGLKKLGSLPESWSDFILAVIAEEAGLIGVIFVIALFAAFAWHGFNIARRQGDLFRYILGTGFTMSIVLQAIVNFAVVAQVLPTTGIPLPFFSHGGSALMMNLCMCGFLINLARTGEREGKRG